jgi:hypothetical protein
LDPQKSSFGGAPLLTMCWFFFYYSKFIVTKADN